MELMHIFIFALMLVSIVLQAKQFTDFEEWRSMVLNAIYLGIIVSLVATTDFLPWL